MGSVPSPEALTVRWAEVIADRTLRDFPYKIELGHPLAANATPEESRKSAIFTKHSYYGLRLTGSPAKR
jgi:hypothetical protein